MSRRVLLTVRRLVHAGTAAIPKPTAPGGKTFNVAYGAAISFGIGSAIGGYMAYDKWKQSQVLVSNTTEDNAFILQEKPPFTPSRSVSVFKFKTKFSV